MNGRGESATKSETLGEFAARLLIAKTEIDDSYRNEGLAAWISPFYSFEALARTMEHKDKYGPWFRVWARKAATLCCHAFEGLMFVPAKGGGFASGKWYVFAEEGLPGTGAYNYMRIVPQDGDLYPPIDKALKLDGRAIMADVRKRGWA